MRIDKQLKGSALELFEVSRVLQQVAWSGRLTIEDLQRLQDVSPKFVFGLAQRMPVTTRDWVDYWPFKLSDRHRMLFERVRKKPMTAAAFLRLMG